MKYIITLLFIGLLAGCSTSGKEKEEGIYDLLFVDENYAYKSIILEDVFDYKEFCGV